MRRDGGVSAGTAQRGEYLAPTLFGNHDRIEAPAAKVLDHATGFADAVLDP